MLVCSLFSSVRDAENRPAHFCQSLGRLHFPHFLPALSRIGSVIVDSCLVLKLLSLCVSSRSSLIASLRSAVPPHRLTSSALRATSCGFLHKVVNSALNISVVFVLLNLIACPDGPAPSLDPPPHCHFTGFHKHIIKVSLLRRPLFNPSIFCSISRDGRVPALSQSASLPNGFNSPPPVPVFRTCVQPGAAAICLVRRPGCDSRLPASD